jgi:hypothetical protein
MGIDEEAYDSFGEISPSKAISTVIGIFKGELTEPLKTAAGCIAVMMLSSLVMSFLPSSDGVASLGKRITLICVMFILVSFTGEMFTRCASAILMTEDFMLSLVPVLEVPGQIGLIICMIIRVLVLFKLSKEHGSYRVAAFLGIANIAASMVDITLGIEDIYLLFMLAVVQMVILIVSEYFEYKAHTEVVMIVDAGISEQWDNYWKWNMYSCIGLVVSMFLIFLMPGPAALAVLAFSIGILVAGIKKLVCLYRSAKVFRARAGK